MVKSPDLLDEEISRRGLLGGLTIFAGGLALSACAGESSARKSSPAETASTSTANTPRETADARPTPTPTTPEAVEQKPLPNPEQIVSREKMDKLFTLPSWGETLAEVKKSGGGEEDAANVITTHMVNVVNALLDPH